MLCFNSFAQNFVKDADTVEDLEATFEKNILLLKTRTHENSIHI